MYSVATAVTGTVCLRWSVSRCGSVTTCRGRGSPALGARHDPPHRDLRGPRRRRRTSRGTAPRPARWVTRSERLPVTAGNPLTSTTRRCGRDVRRPPTTRCRRAECPRGAPSPLASPSPTHRSRHTAHVSRSVIVERSRPPTPIPASAQRDAPPQSTSHSAHASLSTSTNDVHALPSSLPHPRTLHISNHLHIRFSITPPHYTSPAISLTQLHRSIRCTSPPLPLHRPWRCDDRRARPPRRVLLRHSANHAHATSVPSTNASTRTARIFYIGAVSPAGARSQPALRRRVSPSRARHTLRAILGRPHLAFPRGRVLSRVRPTREFSAIPSAPPSSAPYPPLPSLPAPPTPRSPPTHPPPNPPRPAPMPPTAA